MESLPELRRSTTDAKVAGVCVMLADRWRIDPMLVRVAAILLALSSGIGLVLYAAAWIAIPPAGSDRALIDSVLPAARRRSRTVWIIALVIACVIAASALSGIVPFGIGPALVMGAVWYFGFYRPKQRTRVRRPQPPPVLAERPFSESTPFTEAAAQWQERVQAYLVDQGRTPGPNATPPVEVRDPGYSWNAYFAHPDPAGLYIEPPPPPPTPEAVAAAVEAPVPVRKPRRRTGRMHLIGWFLAIAAAVTIIAIKQSYPVPFVALPAAILLAVGVTFIIGAWLPRPRGLFIVAIMLTLITGFTAMGPGVPARETAAVAFADVSQLPPDTITHEVGALEADLSSINVTTDTHFSAAVELGRLVVMVPPEANVRVDWSVGAGEASVLGQHSESGVDMAASTFSPGIDPHGPTLIIMAQVGVGQLEVRR